ncbi:hypothetical protein [Synechococcus sp. UW179B]|uniref:hypothetical protein n=1 Tax=Synechococcus sp. UW179B TaxID=2575516 RepID=UPI000E0EE383|nr:hypothetical protein [Synechococcus sp. UW179B]
MNGAADSAIRALIQKIQPENECQHSIGDGVLRINLKADDLKLWRDTLLGLKEPGNVLLACESNRDALDATRLTWVVGAAIRSTNIDSSQGIVPLLSELGVPVDIAKALPGHCPGLGSEITWAFYLERHGWLTASPIIDEQLLSPAITA